VDIGNLEITRLLLEAGADPDVRLCIDDDLMADLLQTAALPEYKADMMELLLNCGPSLDDDTYPTHLHPLILAAKWNNVDVLQFLLDRTETGANIVRTALEEYTAWTSSDTRRRLLQKADLQEGEEQDYLL